MTEVEKLEALRRKIIDRRRDAVHTAENLKNLDSDIAYEVRADNEPLRQSTKRLRTRRGWRMKFAGEKLPLVAIPISATRDFEAGPGRPP